MSYVQANTGNPLGRRGLGHYTGVRGLGRMGWDNAPYTYYPLPRSVATLNGEFNPAGPDTSTNTNGAVTYRIDPRTGEYNFYRTDIKPRGVFMQNTFQHPAPPVLSALGVTIRRGRTSSGPNIPMRPGIMLSGCDCGGRCSSSLSGPRRRRGLRGLGDPCGPQPDGTIIPCPLDTAGSTEQGSNAPPVGTVRETIDVSNPTVSPITFSNGGGTPIVFSIGGSTQQPQPPAVPWLNQYTMFGSTRVQNSVLAGGAAGFALLLAMMGGKRR